MSRQRITIALGLALALWPTTSRADGAASTVAESTARSRRARPWRISLEAGFEFGGAAGYPDPNGAGPVAGVFARLVLRLPARFSLAATGSLLVPERPTQDTVARLNSFADVGGEVRWAIPVDVGGTAFDGADAYVAIPFGFSSLLVEQYPHRAFVERLEAPSGHYVGLGAGLGVAHGPVGLFGEVRYCYHPIRFTDTITPIDGSQPPLVRGADSAGHQVLILLGGTLGL